MKGYVPLGDSIILRLSGEAEETTDGGIIIPLEMATNFENMAHEVMAISDKSKTTIGVEVGEYVVLRNDCRYKDLQINKKHYIQLDSFHVLGIVDKKSYPTTINQVLHREVEQSKVLSSN